MYIGGKKFVMIFVYEFTRYKLVRFIKKNRDVVVGLPLIINKDITIEDLSISIL